jgi:hypothetical protein
MKSVRITDSSMPPSAIRAPVQCRFLCRHQLLIHGYILPAGRDRFLTHLCPLISTAATRITTN